jgi:predicted transcriptional regulator
MGDGGRGLLQYAHVMSTNVHIEVDEQTADVLQTRAAELGVTVSELVAELAMLESEPISIEADDIAELDRRWKTIEAGRRTVPHERVVRWLRTWGTARFQPWRGR